MERCFVCGKSLPNAWAVGKTETVGGEVRRYCHLHAGGGRPARGKESKSETKTERTGEMSDRKASGTESTGEGREARERAIAEGATPERAKKAWAECAALAAKLGGGIKAIWAKLHPDRSPEATLAALEGDLQANRGRLAALKPALDAAYREIVAKKKEYAGAAAARQRLLKTELQTLLARYKGLEREFGILSENERSIEAVKGRFLEVLAYGKRGRVDEGMVDRLADDVEEAAEGAEGLQDALGELERSGKRKERGGEDFEAALAEFDGELGLADGGEGVGETDDVKSETEKNDEETASGEPRVGDGDWN